ncbi:MAG: MMPL family transporter [Deltaproteobacteria bacterium]|nr:MMPL family transporter [Deltaproteobacteria bacterium]
MDRYIQWVLKRPVFVLVLAALITIGLGMGITRLGFDTSISKFLPETDPEYVYYNKIKKIYGDVDTFVILDISGERLLTPKSFIAMDDLLSDIEFYKTDDPVSDKTRLELFSKILGTDYIDVKSLLAGLSEDPVFSRLVMRKLSAISKGSGVLSSRIKRNLLADVSSSFELRRAHLIDEVISPLNMEDVTGQDDTLLTRRLIDTDNSGKRILPRTPADFENFTKRLTRNPVFKSGIYAANAAGRITDLAFIIRFFDVSDSDAITREILSIVDTYSGRLQILPQGQPVVYVWINNFMQQDLARLVPLVLLIAIIIFFFNFRSIRGVLLPSITLLMGTVWILGLMGFLGFKISTVGISIPILMIAVGSSYGIHILNQYYADFDLISAREKIVGLRISMHHISTTVFLAGFTTVVAFATLCTHQLSAIREWGLFSALGVAFAVLISASVIPAGLALMPHKKDRFLSDRAKQKKASHRSITEMLVRGASTLSLRYPGRTLACVGILIIISLLGISRIQVETELLSFFKPDNYIRTSADQISRKFGGRWGFNILIDSGKADGVKNARFLKTIDEFRGWLTSDKNRDLHIGRTDAFTDYIKTMNMAMNNDDRKFYRVPDSDMDIMDYLEIFSADDEDSDGRIDLFEPYVDPDFRTLNVLARLSEANGHLIGTSALTHIFKRISDHLLQTLPKAYTFKITGHPLMVMKSAGYIVNGQIKSLILTLFVIGFVVFFLLRDFKAALLSLIPMTIAVIINFGLMGWCGIRLDIATSLIAAITIGIGVDDTIHFLNTFKHFRKKGEDTDTAIDHTLCVAGKAIIFTSLALIFGFTALELSTFKPLILFGLLMAYTMVGTTFGALVVLPATIKLTGVRLVRPEITLPGVARSGFLRFFPANPG